MGRAGRPSCGPEMPPHQKMALSAGDDAGGCDLYGDRAETGSLRGTCGACVRVLRAGYRNCHESAIAND